MLLHPHENKYQEDKEDTCPMLNHSEVDVLHDNVHLHNHCISGNHSKACTFPEYNSRNRFVPLDLDKDLVHN